MNLSKRKKVGRMKMNEEREREGGGWWRMQIVKGAGPGRARKGLDSCGPSDGCACACGKPPPAGTPRIDGDFSAS